MNLVITQNPVNNCFLGKGLRVRGRPLPTAHWAVLGVQLDLPSSIPLPGQHAQTHQNQTVHFFQNFFFEPDAKLSCC